MLHVEHSALSSSPKGEGESRLLHVEQSAGRGGWTTLTLPSPWPGEGASGCSTWNIWHLALGIRHLELGSFLAMIARSGVR